VEVGSDASKTVSLSWRGPAFPQAKDEDGKQTNVGDDVNQWRQLVVKTVSVDDKGAVVLSGDGISDFAPSGIGFMGMDGTKLSFKLVVPRDKLIVVRVLLDKDGKQTIVDQGSFGDVHETFARAPAVRSTLEFAGHYSIQHLPEIVCLFLACLSNLSPHDT